MGRNASANVISLDVYIISMLYADNRFVLMLCVITDLRRASLVVGIRHKEIIRTRRKTRWMGSGWSISSRRRRET